MRNPEPSHEEMRELLMRLLEEERKKPVNTTMVRVRPETRDLLERLKKQLDMPFASIIHVALKLLQAQERT